MNYDDENENMNESKDQKPQFDPAGETKQKIMFFVVAVVIVVIAKFVLGL